MNKTFILGGAAAGMIFAGGIAGMVSAQSAATATGLSEEQIIEIALMEVPGEVTDVELERQRGNSVYEIEILATDGTEMEVKIAAESGDILKVKEDGADCNGEHDENDDDNDDTSEDA